MTERKHNYPRLRHVGGLDEQNNLPVSPFNQNEKERDSLLRVMPDLIFENDFTGKFTNVYAPKEVDLFAPREKFLNQSIDEVLPEPIANQFKKAFSDAVKTKSIQTVNYSIPIGENAKEERYFEARVVVCAGDNLLSIVRDITEQKKTEEALRKSEETYRDIVNSSHDIIYKMSANGTFIFLSPSVDKRLGYPKEQLIDKSFLEFVHPDDFEKCINVFAKIINGEQGREMEYRILHADGTWHWHSSNAIVIRDVEGNITGFQGIARDITENKRKEEEILYISQHDALTGLYNREFFNKCIKEIGNSNQSPISFVFADLDGLKKINDNEGHHVGDKLIQLAANIFKKVCRAEDIVTRWGGDEFIIILAKASSEDLRNVVQRIQNECNKTKLQGVPISISLGSATHDVKDKDIMKAIEQAENAMYANKHAKRKMRASQSVPQLEYYQIFENVEND